MTDLEREASEIVREILDACARASGLRDYLDAISAGLDCSPSPWPARVGQMPFKARIVKLAEDYAREIVGSENQRYEHVWHVKPAGSAEGISESTWRNRGPVSSRTSTTPSGATLTVESYSDE